MSSVRTHHHTHEEDGARLQVDARTRRWLVRIVVLVSLLTTAGLVVLWPRGELPRGPNGSAARPESVHGEIVSVKAGRCPGITDDRLPDGSLPVEVACGALGVRLGDDAPAAEIGRVVPVQVGGPVLDAGVAVGDSVLVNRLAGDATASPPAAGVENGGVVYAWSDYARETPIAGLAVGFVVVVLLIVGLRGLAALAGLGMGLATVMWFMLPAMRHGGDPTMVALVGSILIMTVILYAAHGISAKTTTALLGTVAGLAITAALAHWAAGAARMTGVTGQDRQTLTQLVGTSTVSAVVLCGFVLAGLGILNDVTVTQASAVWEVRLAAPHTSMRELFVSGMRVGRDHLASTVYTIAFAYAGAALPSILLISLYDIPVRELLTTGDIAEEIVRTLVGSIGLVLAIPLTTLIAAAVAARASAASAPPHSHGAPQNLSGGSTGRILIERGSNWWRDREWRAEQRLRLDTRGSGTQEPSQRPASAQPPNGGAVPPGGHLGEGRPLPSRRELRRRSVD